MGLGDPTRCVYRFIFDPDDSYDKKIIEYFLMHGILLCIKLNSYMAYMFYAWSLSHNASVLSDTK